MTDENEVEEQGTSTDEMPVVSPVSTEPEPVAPDGSLVNLLHEVEVLAEAHGITLAALHDALHEAIGYRSQGS